MTINKELLQKELDRYKERGIDLKPIRYNRDFVFNLFRKYKYYGMTENSYCCYGEESCCWQEIIEEGVNGLTLKDVRNDILYNLKYIKNTLRSKKIGYRMFVGQKDKDYTIYIYARDTEVQTDYHIWFSNNDE